MALRIKFRALLPISGEAIENGELIIEDGNILEVCSKVSERKTQETLDLSDQLLLPGFINAHSHLGLTALENKLSPSNSFADWIRDLIPVNTVLTDEERARGIHKGAYKMKHSGVTGLADYVSDSSLLETIGGLGFRSILFKEVIGFPENSRDDFLHSPSG